MIDFIDRVSSGKKTIKYENGTTETVTIENAEDATVEGTPINRENMMAVQGFIENDIEITTDTNDNYIITETNPNTNHKLNTNVVENTDGSMIITETFEGEKTITKITTVNADMNIISEVIR